MRLPLIVVYVQTPAWGILVRVPHANEVQLIAGLPDTEGVKLVEATRYHFQGIPRFEFDKSTSRCTVEVRVKLQILHKDVDGCWNELAVHGTHGGQAELPRFAHGML